MSDSAPVKTWIERDGALLRLRLARPKANVLDAPMIAALDAAIDGHIARSGLRGVLIDAEGPNFSFGASVEEHLPDKCAEMLNSFNGLLLKVLSAPVPMMAAVRGQCLGGGLELVAACHHIFLAPDAKLGQPEINLGVIAPAASVLLPERIGRAAAEDILISGRIIDAVEARAFGLATAVADDPVAGALAYFETHLETKSASSLSHAVRAARLDLVAVAAAKLGRLETAYVEELMATRDATEGLEAFIEKRPAKWEHH